MPKLYYFNIKGLGEPIRMCYLFSGKEFEDIHIDREIIAAMRSEAGHEKYGKLPNANWGFPVMDFGDGKLVNQSNALLRLVGKQTGHYPKTDDMLAFKIDQVMETVVDARIPLVSTMYEKINETIDVSDEQKLAMRGHLAEVKIPKAFANFEFLLNDNENGGDYFAGKVLSIADFSALSFMDWICMGVLDGIPEDILDGNDKFPKLKAWYKNMKADVQARKDAAQ